MSLGLDTLTDDQLVDLLQEACAELSTRDGVVRNAAQQVIFSEAEKLKLAREAMAQTVEEQRAKLLTDMKAVAAAEVAKGVADGSIRLVSPEEEANAVAEAEIRTRLTLIESMLRAVEAGSPERFFFEIEGDYLAVSFGGRAVEAHHKLSPQAVGKLGAILRDTLGI